MLESRRAESNTLELPQEMRLKSSALVLSLRTGPFRSRLPHCGAARSNSAPCGTGNLRHGKLSCVLVLAFLIAAPAIEQARADDQRNCSAQTVVRQLLAQAETTEQAYEVRRKAYESAVHACPQEVSLYAALSALLLEHQDAEAALTWTRRGLR